MGTQWLRGFDAIVSDEKKRPMSASKGCTDLFISFRKTNFPSAIRMASSRAGFWGMRGEYSNKTFELELTHNIHSRLGHLHSTSNFCLFLAMMEPNRENTEGEAYNHDLQAIVGDLASISLRGSVPREDDLVSSARSGPSPTFVCGTYFGFASREQRFAENNRSISIKFPTTRTVQVLDNICCNLDVGRNLPNSSSDPILHIWEQSRPACLQNAAFTKIMDLQTVLFRW